MSKVKGNKWLNGAIPALLMHLSIGCVYAWTLFVDPISQFMNVSTGRVQFAFSLAIFFLGMSAAFCGNLIEKNVKISSLLSCIFFCGGLLLCAVAIKMSSIWLLYMGYGVVMGIGLGIGYLAPCKTLMLWFHKNKGLAMGISVMGFGFASTIASPLITFLLGKVGIAGTFACMAGIYAVLMITAFILIKKPAEFAKEDAENKDVFKYSTLLRDKNFVMLWFMFFINIHCGLSLISSASGIMKSYGVAAVVITAVVSIMGICNGGGRLVFAVVSDKLKRRSNIYYLIFSLSIIAILVGLFISNSIGLAICLCMVSALYGSGFSNIAPVLTESYDMKNISKIHGAILSAWGIAGITGNQFTTLIYNLTNSYRYVMMANLTLYIIAFIIIICRNKSVKE